MDRQMKRVLVIGSGGAGKSTFARRLSERTGLPLIHLDAEYWLPGWVEPSRERWTGTVERLIAGDAWIIDGNFGGTMDRRIEACDTVIFLDISRWVCLARVIRRRIRYHGRHRPDMTAGCDERIDPEFVRWIWDYPRTHRAGILERLRALRADQQGVILRSSAEIESFLSNAVPGPPIQPQPPMEPA